MARRSSSNPRYQKGTEVGKTRRSAASAKPKRHLGESAAESTSSAKNKKGKKGKKNRPRLLAPAPTTPEFLRWRKIWMGLLAAAIVFSLGAWQLRDTMPGAVALALAYGCIFGSLYIDFAKMRPLRKSAIEADRAAKEAGSAGKKDRKKDEKTDASGKDA